jgi:hypothetical protein
VIDGFSDVVAVVMGDGAIDGATDGTIGDAIEGVTDRAMEGMSDSGNDGFSEGTYEIEPDCNGFMPRGK